MDLHHKPIQARNTVIWNPQGNIVCVGGFASLTGRMDFYHVDVQGKNVTIKHIKASHAQESPTTWAWSPTGRELMLATLFPRMKVGNCIQLLDYRGELIWHKDFQRLYQATWRPELGAAKKYPPRPPSPRRLRHVPCHGAGLIACWKERGARVGAADS